MAHKPKKQSTGSWKGKRDTHQKTNRQNSVTANRKEKAPFSLGKNTGKNPNSSKNK